MVSIEKMKEYLTRSLSSTNKNKVRGLIAEVELRKYIEELGFGNNVSAGGWIARSVLIPDESEFGENTVALFPETVAPNTDYSLARRLPAPSTGLHTICATMHQIGIRSYFCSPTFRNSFNPETVNWNLLELGVPSPGEYAALDNAIIGFSLRERRYQFLRHNSDVSGIPVSNIAEEFTKELLRVSFQTRYMAQISDIDGILWGRQHTYPLEIKEKTPAHSTALGYYFGLDVGPFVKLAFYAAKRGNLHSIFIVREIDDESTRNLVAWRYVTFDVLAQYASWLPVGGGMNMQGGMSSVVQIPKSRFCILDEAALRSL